MKWRVIVLALLVLLAACAPEGSDDVGVQVATYDVTVDVAGQIVDVYELYRGGGWRMYFGVLRLTGEIKMMGVAY